ncbi:uncharacterized protein CMU_015240 [Cryptosporidium muris RN66]|uniref:Uncharacterized protein n=1 Tax=Cryptosporidium muris (strain RN66) TaxID=441375 RepID=B6AEA1_CRYMR|nr:uncharacterized protein CMU_015240 [Cryptosporidium muris RN66]EEA06847.1 hypothetical protein, conserved [Cryptosporidium muris RN66]|eukprot:XP_002141196.1 hypothetical protein [Cryptosporidium muris RN66]
MTYKTVAIYRDNEGKRIDEEIWLNERIKKKKQKLKESKVTIQKDLPWSTGIIQQKRLEKVLNSKEVPHEQFIRFDGNKSIDEELRNKVYWDDPLFLINSKLVNLNSDKKMISPNNAIKRLKCRFLSPQNRFGIEAGYRWDGVIRGNGYEEKLLLRLNNKEDRFSVLGDFE